MTDRHHEIFGIDRRKAIFTGAAALALAVAAVLGIGQVTSLHHVVRALGRGNHAWFPVCLAGALLAYAGYVGAYRDVARFDGGPVLGAWTTLRIVVIGFGAVLIGSSAGTLSIDYWAIHRAGESRQGAIRRVLAVGSLQWFVLAILACLAAALTLTGPWHAPLAMEVGWLVVVPACVLAAAWVSSPRRSRRLTSPPPGEVDLDRNPRTWVRWLRHTGRAVLANSVGGVVIVRHLLHRPLAHRAALLGFPLYWAGDLLILYAALRAFGVHPHPVPLLLAYATGFVITALPLPAGGSGGVEAGLTFALNSVGIALAPALLGTLVYRAFTLWLPIFPA
ncbi:MAG TPA: lysylphosphatidylglycerol synthase transmembrane domain-containing protein, partial [Gaiellaceae bacterium]|nr:lysylphosphatidylglycerol synthase transmembrane domain-containing protein [Gaiellaceae bacterium]